MIAIDCNMIAIKLNKKMFNFALRLKLKLTQHKHKSEKKIKYLSVNFLFYDIL